MIRVAVTTTSFADYDDAPVRMLKDKGYEIALNPYKRKMKRDELVALAKDAVGLVAGTEDLSAETLSRLPILRVISRCGVGLENVDLVHAAKAGIKVYNTPDAPTIAVAELTIGLILDLLRKVSRMDNAIRSGVWEKRMGNLLAGKKVGIIGYGRIGKTVDRLLRAFGCETGFYDPRAAGDGQATQHVCLGDLFRWADIITIHAAATGMIVGRAELQSIKAGGWLINVARGEAVDENALYACLCSGHLAGAALDVFGREPYTGLLRGLDNVVLTPHIGSYAKESRVRMEKEAALHLIRGLEEK